jgi:soluble lytic murein transglycosylase-like protein
LTRLPIVILLTFAAWAADTAPVAGKPKVKTIVRVDPKTGRLVRSSFALAERPAIPRAAIVPRIPEPQVQLVVAPRIIEPLLSEPRSISASGLVAPMPQRPQPRLGRVPAPPERIREIIEEKSRLHGLDPLLVHSVIRAESNYNPYAISPKGAEGLMQLIPSTARQYGVSNAFDPEQNIEGGIRYLKYLQTLFSDERLVLAAYNAGEGAVAKYGWIPPYAETQDYVYKVGRYYGMARREQAPIQPLVAPLTKTAPLPPVLQESVDGEGRIHITLRQVNQ